MTEKRAKVKDRNRAPKPTGKGAVKGTKAPVSKAKRASRASKSVASEAHVRLKKMLHSRLGRTFAPSSTQSKAMDAVVAEALAVNARGIDAVLTEETFSVALTLHEQAPTVQIALTSSTVAAIQTAFSRPVVLSVIGERPEILQVEPALAAVPEAARATMDWFARVRSMEDECVRDEDIEGVHELRVALRRTRTALRWLSREVIDPQIPTILEHMRELGVMVGPVRDADVVHGMLLKRAPKGPSVTKALSVVEAYRREKVQDMVRYFQSAKTEAKLKEIETGLQRIRNEWVPPVEGPLVTAGDSAEKFFRRELRRVRERLQGNLTVDEGYHDVRRQLRRVRDVIDVCGGALKPSQVIWRERLQPVQSLLGAFNDAVTASVMIRPGGGEVKATLNWLKIRKRQRMSELATPLAVTAALLLNQ